MNPIAIGIAAVIEHAKKHAAIPADVTKQMDDLRTDLGKCTKAQLIEMVVNLKVKYSVKVVQGDLMSDILCDERCQPLTYDEIRDTILDTIQTDQKFSVDNLRWYASKLRVAGKDIKNRMLPTDRAKLDRKIIAELTKG